jgi:DNA topoisomerase VI subunit B
VYRVVGAMTGRQMFATPRAAEFFELRHLQAQTGQPAGRFAEVILKELADNALDAAETASDQPEVTLQADTIGDDLRITVADNGPGMPPELVTRILDFSVLVSDKAAYRSPTRGQQGNALKTVIGIPFATGAREPVVIEARGVRHQIRAGIDPAGEVRVDHQQTPAPERPGATVSATVAADSSAYWTPRGVDVGRWARGYALVNPHATIGYLEDSADPAETAFYKPTAGDGWRKPLPTDPTSAWWYDEAALARLVFAHIGQTRRGGGDLPLGAFVRGFAGLTSTAKAKTVCAKLPTVRRLSDFEADPDAIATLLAAMQAASRPPKPAALGRVDEQHYRACFADWYGVRRFWLKRAATTHGAIPWVVEVAVAETTEPGELHYAVNYSPTFGDPLARLPLAAGEVFTTGAESFLRQVDAYPDGDSHRAAAIHVICPALQFLDRGKTTLEVPR